MTYRDGTPVRYIVTHKPDCFKRCNGGLYSYKTVVTMPGYKKPFSIDVKHSFHLVRKKRLIDTKYFYEYFEKEYGIKINNSNLGSRFFKRDGTYYQFISFIDVVSTSEFDIIHSNHLRIERKKKLNYIF